MTIGILGSGAVGVGLARGFLSEGHEVFIATREPDGEKGKKLKNDLNGAKVTDFASAAKSGELIVLCVNSSGLEEAVKAAGAENLSGKVVIDTTNSIKQEDSMMVYDAEDRSKAEKVQDWLGGSKVVKAFNTVGAAMMYKPDFDGQVPTMFIAGDDSEAKTQVGAIVKTFGWESLDSGRLIASRSLEPMGLVWINHAMASGSPHHAFKML
jgi:predicted dinucleotide-binding enzyme